MRTQAQFRSTQGPLIDTGGYEITMTESGHKRTRTQDAEDKQQRNWKDLNLDIGAVTLAGGRANNEDSLGIFIPAQQQDLPPHLQGIASTVNPERLGGKGILLTVADGMGGGRAGKTASNLAVNRLGDHYFDEVDLPNIELDLIDSVAEANKAVYSVAASSSSSGGEETPGSTIVAAVLHDDRAYIANVGDSRAYLVRGRHIEQITKDHVPKAGSHLLTRSLGERDQVEVDTFEQPFELDDTLILCSDGLTDLIEDQEIHRLISGNTAQRAAERLAQTANNIGQGQLEEGAYDNITVVVARRGVRKSLLPIGPIVLGGLAILVILIFIALAVALTRILPSEQETTVPTYTTTSQPIETMDTPTSAVTLPPPPTSDNLAPPLVTSAPESSPRGPTSTPRITSTPYGGGIVVPPELAGESPVPNGNSEVYFLSVISTALLITLLATIKAAVSIKKMQAWPHQSHRYATNERAKGG